MSLRKQERKNRKYTKAQQKILKNFVHIIGQHGSEKNKVIAIDFVGSTK